MAHVGDGAKKKHKSDVAAAAAAAAAAATAPAAQKKAAGIQGEGDTGAAVHAPAGGPFLNLAAGEEVTGLTEDEMASVCDKLEQFARKNPHRVGLAGTGGDGSRR